MKKKCILIEATKDLFKWTAILLGIMLFFTTMGGILDMLFNTVDNDIDVTRQYAGYFFTGFIFTVFSGLALAILTVFVKEYIQHLKRKCN